MLEAQENVQASKRRGRNFHPTTPAKPPVTLFDHAVQRLRLTGNRRAMANLFGSRVTRQAIINWRRGRRQPPVWALVTAHGALQREADSFAHLAALLAAELEKRNTKT